MKKIFKVAPIIFFGCLLNNNSNAQACVGIKVELIVDTPHCVPTNAQVSINGGGNPECYEWYDDGSLVQLTTPWSRNATTVAGGNGSGTGDNQLTSPQGIYVDAGGNIYIADKINNRVMLWAPGATTGTVVAGGNGLGSGDNQLNLPTGIYVDGGGNIFVADKDNSRIMKWAPGAINGVLVAGGNDSGSALNQLDHPYSIIVDTGGNLFISDRGNNRIVEWTAGALEGIVVAGGNGHGIGLNQLNSPEGICFDLSGNLVIADRDNNRIMQWIPGAASGSEMLGTSTGVSLGQPSGGFVDGAGLLFVADTDSSRVLFGPGSIIAGVGGQGGNSAELHHPNSIFLDDNTLDLYVADTRNNRIQKFAYDPDFKNTFNIHKRGNYSVGIVLRHAGSTGAFCHATSNIVRMKDIPFLKGNIVGPDSVHAGDTVSYSIKPHRNKGYNWTVPSDAIIIDGLATDSITVVFGQISDSITVYSFNDCGASGKTGIYVNVDTTTGLLANRFSKAGKVSKNNLQPLVAIFPNPATNTASVSFSSAKQNKYTIELTDVTGKVLLRKEGISAAGKNTIIIDVSRYSKGFYFINLTDNENGRRSLKLDKE